MLRSLIQVKLVLSIEIVFLKQLVRSLIQPNPQQRKIGYVRKSLCYPLRFIDHYPSPASFFPLQKNTTNCCVLELCIIFNQPFLWHLSSKSRSSLVFGIVDIFKVNIFHKGRHGF